MTDSEEEDQSHNSGRHNIRKPLDFEVGEDGEDVGSGGAGNWREELQRRYQQENDFLAELRSRNANLNAQQHNNQQNQNHHSNQIHNQHQHQIQNQNQNQSHQSHQSHQNNHQNNHVNQDYQSGEREEAEGEKRDDCEAEWSEAVKRWVNR